jgi:hypothetical protein
MPLDEQIAQLSDKQAMRALALVLAHAGLEPDPFAKDQPDEQLREALAQPDLAEFAAHPEPPPTEGEIARTTLSYLAEQDQAFRASIAHVVSRDLSSHAATTRLDLATFAVGALVLLAFRTDLTLRKAPDKGWFFEFKLKPLKNAPIGKLLTVLYAKYLG